MSAAAGLPDHVAPDRVLDFDIYGDPRITQDVQGSYASIFKDAPDIFWTPRNGGHWIALRYEMIAEIVKDPEHFSCREMQIPRVPNPPVLIPLSLDPPDNIPYRQILMPMFSGKSVRQMEQKLRDRAVELVEEVADRGECDFAYDIAARYPVSVFMDVMGMPVDRLREFRALADRHFSATTKDEYAAVDPKIIAVMTEFIEQRREAPTDDLIGQIAAAEIEGRKLTLKEMQAMCFLLFLGGMDTVTNATGFAYQQLAQDPGLQARLSENPQMIPQFVEEALRLYGVVSTPRLVVQDCDRFGVSFREGEMLLCLLPMAGRDDRMNANPDVLDIDRPQKAHLTFSSGPHLCVGHMLARAEIRVLTEEWLKLIPRFSPAAGAVHKFRQGNILALESLPLQWPAGSDDG